MITRCEIKILQVNGEDVREGRPPMIISLSPEVEDNIVIYVGGVEYTVASDDIVCAMDILV